MSAVALRWLVSDSLVLARRNLAHVRQIPEKLIDVTLQPLMFVLLFAYVFGGVIHVPGGNYREYLIGGILVQTIAFGMVGPATGILWLGTFIGLLVRSADAVTGVIFKVIFPMTFLSSAFVPLGGLPAGLRTVAAWNPISAIIAAIRALFGNPTALPSSPPLPLQHPVLAALIWCIALLALCAPLAIWRYRARTAG